MGAMLIGTASWTDRTLIESGWYPPGVTTPAERLGYYASRFPLVEVDSTYYAPPATGTTRAWVERTPPGFTFNIKAFSLLTGHPTRPGAIYRDLRERLGATARDRAEHGRYLYPRDLDQELIDEVWRRFVAALEPLARAGKLGMVLFQSPPWFPVGEANRRYVLECLRRSQPLRICVEFRNHTWMNERNRERTLDFLASYAIPYVCVDMPQGHPESIPPVAAATSPEFAVVRFHGHSAAWTSHDIREKFGYRYDETELRKWVPRLRELSEQARTTHVLFNNCYRDYAQTNAAQLASLLDAAGVPAAVPASPVAPATTAAGTGGDGRR